MTIWVGALLVGAGSYLLRALPLTVGARLRLPDRAEEGLRHAGTGGITALLVLAVLGLLQPSSGVPLVPAVGSVVVAAGLGLLRRSMPATVLAGAATYGLLYLATLPALHGG